MDFQDQYEQWLLESSNISQATEPCPADAAWQEEMYWRSLPQEIFPPLQPLQNTDPSTNNIKRLRQSSGCDAAKRPRSRTNDNC
ncbi:Anc_7.495 (Scer_YGOB_Anc_7.495) [Zygosaccharomyces parabailii]|nr:Anc_7.495 (Scer_YGOB_Anc_7.495) [Zygosaccharomyces parabailii]